MAFVNIKEFIETKMQNISTVPYIYSDERQLNSFNGNNEVVIKRLSGEIYSESSQIPVQIEITTDDPEKVIDDFTALAMECNNKSFESIIEEGEDSVLYLITPIFNTPTVIDADIRIGSKTCCRLITFSTFNITRNVSNVKKIAIDNEELEIENGTFGYTATPRSNRVSGQELTPSKKEEASSMLSLAIIGQNTIFTRKLFLIQSGALAGNTAFSVKIELTNGLEATLSMFVTTATLGFGKNKIPVYNVSLSLFDGGSN